MSYPVNESDPSGLNPLEDFWNWLTGVKLAKGTPTIGGAAAANRREIKDLTSCDDDGGVNSTIQADPRNHLSQVGPAVSGGLATMGGIIAVNALAAPLGGGEGDVVPVVANSKLGNIVRDLYKGANTANPIGTGSTADAIRNELVTGLPTGGRFHSTKGSEYIAALGRWLRGNPNACHHDRLVARSLLQDLKDALNGR